MVWTTGKPKTDIFHAVWEYWFWAAHHDAGGDGDDGKGVPNLPQSARTGTSRHVTSSVTRLSATRYSQTRDVFVQKADASGVDFRG